MNDERKTGLKESVESEKLKARGQSTNSRYFNNRREIELTDSETGQWGKPHRALKTEEPIEDLKTVGKGRSKGVDEGTSEKIRNPLEGWEKKQR